jgi:hypothetical protein
MQVQAQWLEKGVPLMMHVAGTIVIAGLADPSLEGSKTVEVEILAAEAVDILHWWPIGGSTVSKRTAHEFELWRRFWLRDFGCQVQSKEIGEGHEKRSDDHSRDGLPAPFPLPPDPVLGGHS